MWYLFFVVDFNFSKWTNKLIPPLFSQLHTICFINVWLQNTMPTCYLQPWSTQLWSKVLRPQHMDIQEKPLEGMTCLVAMRLVIRMNKHYIYAIPFFGIKSLITLYFHQWKLGFSWLKEVTRIVTIMIKYMKTWS